MRASRSWVLATLTLAVQTVLGAPPKVDPRAGTTSGGSVDTWLATESTVALERILSNIGSTGQYAASAKSGVVIASPSTDNPDCRYLPFPFTRTKMDRGLTCPRLLHVEP